jgi:hypothetical protein
MDPFLRAAESALRRSAEPALRLGELLRHVRADTRDLLLDGERLLSALRARPDRFRVLDPWRGPWRFIREPDSGDPPGLDPWVVVVTDPADGDGDGVGMGVGRPSALRLRACVRWLARGVDGRSRCDVVRWSALAAAAAETHRALSTAA